MEQLAEAVALVPSALGSTAAAAVAHSWPEEPVTVNLTVPWLT
jgi:hypothetical protein